MRKPFYVDLVPSHSGVTGSCFHLKAVFPDRSSYTCIVDCGLFEGRNESEFNKAGFFPFLKSSNILLITHNHVDHTGRVPELIRAGFAGNIYASKYTASLLEMAWRDCEKIEKLRARKEKRYPSFKPAHITQALRKVVPVDFFKRYEVHKNVFVTFLPNGHVFGAAMVLLEFTCYHEDYKPINFLFTGDYRRENFLFNVPKISCKIKEMPVHMICEATYGEDDRQATRKPVFEENIAYDISMGRVVLIPVFAFERGQIILATLSKMQRQKKIDPNIPIYVDGKLFRSYTLHYTGMKDDFFDKLGDESILPKNCHPIRTVLQREKILGEDVAKIIVASGGMMSYGPSQAYINSIIQNPNASIHFTGYQCEGSMGYNLQKAEKAHDLLEINGRLMPVRCHIHQTEEFSAHALRDDLIELIRDFPNRKSVSLNHGTMDAKHNLAKDIINRGIEKEVGVLSRKSLYRYSPYKLEKVVLDISAD